MSQIKLENLVRNNTGLFMGSTFDVLSAKVSDPRVFSQSFRSDQVKIFRNMDFIFFDRNFLPQMGDSLTSWQVKASLKREAILGYICAAEINSQPPDLNLNVLHTVLGWRDFEYISKWDLEDCSISLFRFSGKPSGYYAAGEEGAPVKHFRYQVADKAVEILNRIPYAKRIAFQFLQILRKVI